MVLTFESVEKNPDVNTQMKATEQYFPVVLFFMLYKVVLTCKSVVKILKCNHSSEGNEQFYHATQPGRGFFRGRQCGKVSCLRKHRPSG